LYWNTIETNIGKSIFVENLAANAYLAGKNVILFSLEMRKHQVQFRIESRLTGIQYTKFRLGDFIQNDFDKWKKSIKLLKETQKNWLEIVHLTNDCTVDNIENLIYEIQDEYNEEADEIIVDYLNLMYAGDDNKASSRDALAQADISWGLRKLSGNLNGKGIPVITPCQLTDESKKVEFLDTQHIKYSRGTVENSSIVYGLKQTKDNKLEGTMQLQLIKTRDGERFKPILLRPQFDIMLINDEIVQIESLDDL